MKYFSVFLISFLSVLSSGLQSCKQLPPVDEKKFVKIYADMILMQDTSSLSQREIKEEVLKRLSVENTDYDETIKFYNADPERWKKFFDSTIAHIESLKPKPKKIDVKSLPEQSVSLDKKDL